MIVGKAPLKYKDGTSPRVIMFTVHEMLNWGGMNCCDFCNRDIITEEDNYGFIIPNAYGNNGICQECYNKFVKNGKLYEEDKKPAEEQAMIEYYSKFALGGVVLYEED